MRRNFTDPIRRRLVVAGTAVLVAGVTLWPSGGATASPAPPGGESATAAQTVAAGQSETNGATTTLSWRTCAVRFQCAVARVPLDYDQPAGQKIALAALKRPADDQQHKIGTLFVNPGGPGGSGVDFARYASVIFPPQVLVRFDVVGFDPRGVSRSTPLTCFRTPTDFEIFDGQPAFPVTPAEVTSYQAASRKYTDLCRRNAGLIAAHMSTANVARDLDLLRAAVGDSRLNYAGYSYGTELGGVYAAMFPGKVRAMVLDGVIDPRSWDSGAPGSIVDERLQSDKGAYKALQAFFSRCDAAGDDACRLAGNAKVRYDRLLTRLKRSPVDLHDGYPPLSYAEVVSLTLSVLYDAYSLPFLGEAIQYFHEAVFTSGTRPHPALRALRVRWEGKVPGSIVTPTGRTDQTRGVLPPAAGNGEAFHGVTCVDAENPADPAAWPLAAARRDAVAPYFGAAWLWGTVPCATWPGRDSDRYSGPYGAPTANPVLVIGNSFDPATTYQQAVSTSQLMPGAKLLSLQGGFGHTSAGTSLCVDQAVANYLLTARTTGLPDTCKQDYGPFESQGELRTDKALGFAKAKARSAAFREAMGARF